MLCNTATVDHRTVYGQYTTRKFNTAELGDAAGHTHGVPDILFQAASVSASMIPRLTRTGQIFSPYNLGKNFDATQLVERARLDINGADHWDITPVEPLSPSSLCAPLSPLPPLTPSPELPPAASLLALNAVPLELLLPPPLVDPTPVVAAHSTLCPSTLAIDMCAGSATPVGAIVPNQAKRSRRLRRKKQRVSRQPDLLSCGPPPIAMKHIDNAKVLSLPLRLQALPIAKGAFVGKRQSVDGERQWTLEDLKADGFEVFEWDGITPYILADAQERVVAILAGRPVDTSWDAVVREANQAMEATAKKCCFQEQHLNHRRGFFPALATGFSYGGGQKMPGNFCNTPPNAAALDELCQNRAIKRIAGFGCTAYSLYAPKVHRSTCASLKKLCKEHPTLRFNFPNSMFPAATFNFGPDADIHI
ncbi:hypothetical protein C8Q78DRAFT_1082085 [Trametes maxima]|nr:hypothetical protein C8Q78DRAFT_1082085 [Trametes maxima]